MTDGVVVPERTAITALRFAAFACAFPLYLVASAIGQSVGLGFGVAAFAVAADAMFVLLSGARGRAFVYSVGVSAALWAVIAVLVTPDWFEKLSENAVCGWLILVVAVATIVVLPRAQALWMWLVTSLAAAALVLGQSSGLARPEIGLATTIAAICLAAGSVGALGFYLRTVRSQRRGWRHLTTRLGLIALAVGCSVIVSGVAAIQVGQFGMTSQGTEARFARETYASRISESFSAAFSESEFASPTPALARELQRIGALGNVGLSVYDLDAKRVTIAVRRVTRDKSTLSSMTPDPTPWLGDAEVFAGVELDARERAAVFSAAKSPSGRTGDAASRVTVGALPPYATALGFRSESARLATRASQDTAAYYVFAGAKQPDGDRFRLVVSEPTTDWAEWDSQNAEQLGRDIGVQLAPWLFFAFMLPCVLGLLALDRRDTARQKLAASEERARLNRDAHDRVYNRLTALANQLAATQTDETTLPAPADEIRRTVSDLQSILGDGESARVDAADAAASLMADVCADQARVWSMEVSLEGADALLGVDPRVGWGLVCVAEEALTNAGRHGGATRARVALARGDRALTLTVADDGSGIAGPLVDGLPASASGMRGMAERARALQGRLEVTTGSEGTTLTITIPLAR